MLKYCTQFAMYGLHFFDNFLSYMHNVVVFNYMLHCLEFYALLRICDTPS